MQLQPKETFEVHSTMQERDETVQLPSTESNNSPVQVETLDPSINKEAIQAKEFPTVVDNEEIVQEPPVQPCEVQGK